MQEMTFMPMECSLSIGFEELENFLDDCDKINSAVMVEIDYSSVAACLPVFDVVLLLCNFISGIRVYEALRCKNKPHPGGAQDSLRAQAS